jgi:hypothetical protein
VELFCVLILQIAGDFFTGRLHLFLVNLAILETGNVFDVEALEKADEVEVLGVSGAEGELLDDELDVLVLELEVLEHLDQVLFGYCLLAVLDLLKRRLQLLWVLGNHLCHPQQHILLFLLINQLKLINHLFQLS